jgi:hypothetical protein
MTMIMEGGPYMQVLLVCGILMQFVIFVPTLVGMFTVRAPAAIWFALAQVPMFFGLLGTASGLDLTLRAAGNATSERVPDLVASGIATSLYPFIAGCFVYALTAVGLGVFTGLGAAIGVGGTRRLSWFGPVAAVVLGLLAVGGLVAGSWLGGSVALLSAISLGLASLQVSDVDTHN